MHFLFESNLCIYIYIYMYLHIKCILPLFLKLLFQILTRKGGGFKAFFIPGGTLYQPRWIHGDLDESRFLGVGEDHLKISN